MNKTEKQVFEKLKSEGFLVEKVVKTQWQRNDFFNLWDFIAVSPQTIRFVQVSSLYLSEGSHAGKDYKGFPCPSNCSTEFWRWDKKKKDFVIKILNGNNPEDNQNSN